MSELAAGAAGLPSTERIEPFKILYQAGRTIRTGVKAATGQVELNEKDVYNAAKYGLMIGGIPVPAVEKLARSVYDFEEEEIRPDLWQLLSRGE